MTSTDPDADADGTRHVSATAELFAREWAPLNRLAFLLTSSEVLAEEIVAEAFARLQASRSTVTNPGGYVRTCVVNLAHSHHRHQAVVERTVWPRVDPTSQSADELSDVLAKLPWRQQAALAMRFHLDLPDIEIAAALDCRPATVRSLIRRALITLRKELEP